ncbi:MAG: metal-sensitive transcriptional regulator [Acidobacteria bacterium]|nr:metal-sensitive transcriptional regulator [Acidobacteriota bacterium]
MNDSATPDLVGARLRRIEGQIRGIARMLENDRACEDIVTQLMAVRSGIDTAGALILDTHLERCLAEDNSPERIAALRDSMKLWWRFAPGAAGFAPAEDPDAEPAEQPAP